MPHGLRSRVLPAHQRRTLDELTDELDLRSGDRSAKLSAFWTMLTLSAVIASAGVLADSTATVIGAMIIAPLSTPIMGIALGVVEQRPNGALRYVASGGALVVAIGAVASLAVPGGFDLLGNAQISGRTSPSLVDLVAAVATGLAGAVALARRDVAAVLPGVAIAISLVPPLAVVGVCLGQGAAGPALGASLLFLSNLLALVLAGILTFAALGYTGEAVERRPTRRRRPYLVLAVLMTLVALPLAANTVVTWALTGWTDDIRTTTEDWLADTADAEVTDVEFVSATAHVHVRHTGELPGLDELKRALDAELPAGLGIVVDTSVGREVDLGTTD
jgi:uncharacterized hydrophobic protein (TIGR00271 family)